MKQKYNAEGYLIHNCYWIEECYFCDYSLGTLNLTKRMITCNTGKDLTKDITLQDLVDKDVIQVVKSKTYTTTTATDPQLKGKIKKWTKVIIK